MPSINSLVVIKKEQLPWGAEMDSIFSVEELQWLLAILCETNYKGECHLSLNTLLQINGVAGTPANRKQVAAIINALIDRKQIADQLSLFATQHVDADCPNEPINVHVKQNWVTADGAFVTIRYEHYNKLRSIALQEHKDLSTLLLLLLSLKSAFVSYEVPGQERKMAGCWFSKQQLSERCGIAPNTTDVYLDLMQNYEVISILSGKYLRLANVYSMAEDKAVLPIILEAQQKLKRDVVPKPKRICMSKRGIC